MLKVFQFQYGANSRKISSLTVAALFLLNCDQSHLFEYLLIKPMLKGNAELKDSFSQSQFSINLSIISYDQNLPWFPLNAAQFQ